MLHYDDEGESLRAVVVGRYSHFHFLLIPEELEETILEPIVKVKEEEIERKYHEFNEFFAGGILEILFLTNKHST